MPCGIPCRAGYPCSVPPIRTRRPPVGFGYNARRRSATAAQRGTALCGVAYIVMIGAAVGLAEAAGEEEAVAFAIDVADADDEDDDDAA